MQREFAQDHLEFGSVPRLLAQSAGLYFRNLPRIAAVMLIVFLPAKLVLEWLCPESGVWTYAASAASDLVLGALAAPAVVALLSGKSFGQALRWGRRWWAKCLWNEFKMQVTVALWGLLLIIPGVVAAVRLAFTDVVVAVEGDRAGDVLERSRALSKGYRWRIFFVLAAIGLVELLVWGAALRLKLGMALTDSLLAVVSQWTLTATLLMYRGITRASEAA